MYDPTDAFVASTRLSLDPILEFSSGEYLRHATKISHRDRASIVVTALNDLKFLADEDHHSISSCTSPPPFSRRLTASSNRSRFFGLASR